MNDCKIIIAQFSEFALKIYFNFNLYSNKYWFTAEQSNSTMRKIYKNTVFSGSLYASMEKWYMEMKLLVFYYEYYVPVCNSIYYFVWRSIHKNNVIEIFPFFPQPNVIFSKIYWLIKQIHTTFVYVHYIQHTTYYSIYLEFFLETKPIEIQHFHKYMK